MSEKKVTTGLGYRSIDVAKIDRPHTPVRFGISDESVQDLADSIKQTGLIEPVILRPKGERYELVAGDRRLAAYRLLDEKRIKAIVVNVSDSEAEAIKVHENMKRLNVSPVEEAVYFSYLVQKKKMKQSEIAVMMGVSEGYVSQRLAVMSWNENLISAVDEGKISFSSARELSRITEESALLLHLGQAIEHGVTPRVANIWWQDWMKSQSFDLHGQKGGGDVPKVSTNPDTSFDCSLCGDPHGYRELVYMRLCPDCADIAKLRYRAKKKENDESGK